MSTPSNKQILIAAIKANPGIRTPELVDMTSIDNPAAYITGEIDRKEILVEKINPEHGGRPLNTYRINAENPPDETLTPGQRMVKADVSAKTIASDVSFALSSRGELTITDGRKTVSLPPDGTRQLVAYLDRINVDQVMRSAGVA